jgi:putative Ca2+/H+ antiporter (TMEM165/GDT1 family)
VFTATLVALRLGTKRKSRQSASLRGFEQFFPVVIGTTLGMMLANIPAVPIGDRIAEELPIEAIRITAAVVCTILGVLTLAGGSV